MVPLISFTPPTDDIVANTLSKVLPSIKVKNFTFALSL